MNWCDIVHKRGHVAWCGVAEANTTDGRVQNSNSHSSSDLKVARLEWDSAVDKRTSLRVQEADIKQCGTH